ncbi:MAG: GDSL-type esterase/lipase family protein [Sphingobacterium sp.]
MLSTIYSRQFIIVLNIIYTSSIQKMKLSPVILLYFLVAGALATQAQEIDSLKRPAIYKTQVTLHQALKQSNKDLVFLGNSITFWAAWSELVPSQKHLKNRGIPGDNSYGVLERLDDILSGRPRMIFLMIGINDLAQGIPENVLLDNIKRITMRTKEKSPNTTLIIQSILPTNKSFNQLINHYKAQDQLPIINEQLKTIAEEYKVVYLDLYTHFINADGLLKEEFSWDGVHLTLLGYQQWVQILKKNGYLKQ